MAKTSPAQCLWKSSEQIEKLNHLTVRENDQVGKVLESTSVSTESISIFTENTYSISILGNLWKT